jgi:hypothetical protein
MKKWTFLFAGFFMLACNNEGNKSAGSKVTFSDLVAENLKGDISSIEETPYQTDSTGKIGAMDSCCIGTSQYDENGNVVKYTSKDSKGTLKEEGTITRYENGMWKGQKNMKDGKTNNSIETSMGDKGIYTGALAYDSTGKLEFYYTGLTQNAQGQITGWKQYDKDSVFRAEGANTYDKYKQLSFTMKDSVGKVRNSGTTKYNDKGEQVENSNTNVTKDSTTTTVTKYTYETYDDMGNWTKRTAWNEKGKATKIAKRVYTYRKKE